MVQGSSQNYRKPDDRRQHADRLKRERGSESKRNDEQGQHRASQAIRAEIDRTRANLDRTVDALQGRLNPQTVVKQAFDSLREDGGDLAHQALQILRRNIGPAAMIASGVAWLAINESRSSSKRPRSDSKRVSTTRRFASSPEVEPCDEFGRGVDRPMASRRTGTSVSSRISMGAIGDYGYGGGPSRFDEDRDEHHKSGGLKDLRSQAMHRMHDVRDYMGERASKVGHQIQHGAYRARDWFEQMVDEYPFAVGAGFFALGMAAGFAIPATRPEQRYLGRYRDRLVSKAEEYGSELIDKGQEVAHKAVAAVQESVGSAQRKSGQNPRRGDV